MASGQFLHVWTYSVETFQMCSQELNIKVSWQHTLYPIHFQLFVFVLVHPMKRTDFPVLWV
eukprot:scaffold2482_cov196-Alexandrium_tamarense.AAC.6